MTWSEVLLAFLGASGGMYFLWFVFDCWWRGDWYLPDPPK